MTAKILTMGKQEKKRNMQMVFGMNLARIIARQNLSQNKLAALMGVTPPYINRIVKGQKWVRRETLDRLCELLHAEPWEFYIEANTPVISSKEELRVMGQYREAKELQVHENIAQYATYVIEAAKRGEHGATGESGGVQERQKKKKAVRRHSAA